MKPRKLTPAVLAAKQAAEAKQNELAEAREAVKRLDNEYAKATVAVREAQEAADASLPQCRLVCARYGRSNDIRDGGARAVILRRTPVGMLVVRHVGNADGCEYKFKWSTHCGQYIQAERTSYLSDRNELRDVPPEFMPTAAQESA